MPLVALAIVQWLMPRIPATAGGSANRGRKAGRQLQQTAFRVTVKVGLDRRRNPMKDCWQVLGIPSTTDVETVKRAYRALIKRYHPDTISSGSPEMVRRYTIRCRRINQAFRQAIERCATGTPANIDTGVHGEEAEARRRGGGATRWAGVWRPPERPPTEGPRSIEAQKAGRADLIVSYFAPLLVMAFPLLILCFVNMLRQMAHLLAGR